jgi:hypothetical protein
MKNISKIIVSLLASIALTVSANAGELSVTGSAKATMSSVSGYANGGNAIGVANEIGFGATGDLDNGWSWNYAIALDPDGTAAGGNALNDDSKLLITTPYGTVGFCGSTCGLSAAGDFNANAYAWITDTGFNEGKIEPVNISSYQNINLHSPAGLLPLDTVLKFGYAPNSSTVNNSTNAVNTANTTTVGQTLMYRLETAPVDGLKITASYAKQDPGTNVSADEQDSQSGAISAKYSQGPFTVGVGTARIAPRIADNLAATATTVEYYDNKNLSVAMAVNDNLSISGSVEKSDAQYSVLSSDGKNETKAIQAAYTMGGMTLALSHANKDGIAYSTTNNVSETIFALTMAF